MGVQVKSGMFESVGAILRQTSAVAVMPRFAPGAAVESHFKSPGELVTAADREAERLISAELTNLLPGSRVIGEEACADAPSLLKSIGYGTVWIVDPIDGTANFAAGRAPFAMMIALLTNGTTVGAWIFDPVRNSLAMAGLGEGAWIDGQRLSAHGDPPALAQLHGIVSTAFCPDEHRPGIERVGQAVAGTSPTARCAGHEYPLVARGERDFALYWRTLAWDHAPGALLVTEADGSAIHLDGSLYSPTRSPTGLLISHRREMAPLLLEQIQGSAMK